MIPPGDGDGADVSGTDEGGTVAPHGFTREEFERVIRRASELQFEDTAQAGPRDLVDEGEVLRVGREVGLDRRHLRRALEELRAESLRPRVPDDPGVLARVLGPGFIRVSRVVPGPAASVDARLAEHLEVGESLMRIRKRGDASLWEPAGGVVASLQRAVGWRGFSYDLVRARSVEMAVSEIAEGHALVTLISDLRRTRTETGAEWIIGFGLLGTALSTGLGFLVGVPLLALPGAVVGAGAGGSLARNRFESESARLRLVMEGILDRLESGDPLATRAEGPWSPRRRR